MVSIKSLKVKLAALALVATFITGLAGTAAAKVTITQLGYAAHGQAFRDWVDWAAKEFMAANPDIQIDIIVTPSNEYVQKMNTMYAAGAGLDVVELTLSAGTYAASGMFLDLKPLFNRDKEVSLDMWPKPVMDGFTMDGQIWGLPLSPGVWMTWFNQDLFNQAGLINPHQMGDSWDWENLLRIGKKLTLDTNGDGMKDQYGVDRASQHWSNGIAPYAAGADLYNRYVLPTKPNVNSPMAKRALQFVADIYNNGITQPYGSSTMAQYYFWTGKSAIDITDTPAIHGAYMKSVTFDWDIAVPLRGPAGRGTPMQVGGIQVMSNTQQTEAVWKWVMFLMARRESIEKYVALTGSMPAFKGAHARYKELVPFAPKSWKLVFDTMAAATTNLVYVHHIGGLNQWKTGPLMSAVFSGQKDPGVALDEAQALELANVKAYFDKQTK